MNSNTDIPETTEDLLTFIAAALRHLQASTEQSDIPELPFTHRSAKEHAQPAAHVPLQRETRVTLPTREAAYHLDRKEQTLRIWASKGTGPVRPLRVNGRLAWPVDDIRKALGVSK